MSLWGILFLRWRVFVLLFVAWISLNLLFIILNYLDNVKAGAPYMEALMLSIYRSIKSSWVILIILALFVRYGGSWGKIAWMFPALLYLILLNYILPYSDQDVVKILTTSMGVYASITCLIISYIACVVSFYIIMRKVFKRGS